eukprot:613872-Pelagomonas_calceolata.AAC.3
MPGLKRRAWAAVSLLAVEAAAAAAAAGGLPPFRPPQHPSPSLPACLSGHRRWRPGLLRRA